MNRQTFLDSFGPVADAPGGIENLRRLVLELAFQGRLTAPEPDDRPAALSIEEAMQSREVWTEPSAPAKYSRKDSGYPFGQSALPPSWAYCRLGEIMQLVNGRAYKKAEWRLEGTPVIRIQNLNGGDDYYFSDLELKAHNYCHDGDLLFAWSASFGPYIWLGEKAIFHYHIWKVVTSPALSRRFGYYLLQAMTSAVKSASHGLAMLHMTKEAMEGLNCPIPPVTEQRRIVERIDELMVLCDELEQQQAARTGARTALTAATLHRIAETEGGSDLRSAISLFAERIDIHLAPGDGDLAALKRLRQTIFDLAVRGRLTYQDPADLPAPVLLDQIASERDRLVSAKEIPKPKKFHEVTACLGDADLPSGWARARASEFFIASDSGWSPRCMVEPAGRGDWGVLKTSAVSRGVFDPGESKKLPRTLEPRPKLEVQPGEFVMIRASGSKSLVGRGAIVTETESRLMLSDKHIRLTFLHEASSRFWAILNESTAVQAYYSDESSGTSTMSNVTRERIGTLAVAVPPLSEQLRIAETVDMLVGLCDDLKQQLVLAESLRGNLAASIAAHVVPEASAEIAGHGSTLSSRLDALTCASDGTAPDGVGVIGPNVPTNDSESPKFSNQ